MVQEWANVTMGGWLSGLLVLAGLGLLACGGLLLIAIAAGDPGPLRAPRRPARPHPGVIGWRQLHPDWQHPGSSVAGPSRPATTVPFTLALTSREGRRRVAPPPEGVPGWPSSGA